MSTTHRVIPEPEVSSIEPLDLYFQEVRKTPLLTSEEEREIGIKLTAGKAAKHALAARDGALPEEQRLHYETCIAESNEASNWLARANQRLVISIAKQYQDRDVLFLDLIQDGNKGLVKAIERMDWQRGVKFSTYAFECIQNEIIRAVLDTGYTIRIPEYLLRQIHQYDQCCTAFLVSHGREATPKEIADHMGKTKRQIKWYQRAMRMQPTSLDEPPRSDDGLTTVGDMVASDGPTVEQLVTERDTASYIHELFARLSPQEALVLTLRYGLEDGERKTLTEVGKMMKTTKQYVYQSERQAIRRLKNMVQEKPKNALVKDSAAKSATGEENARNTVLLAKLRANTRALQELRHDDQKKNEAEHKHGPYSLIRQQHAIPSDIKSTLVTQAQQTLPFRDAEVVALFIGTYDRKAASFQAIGKILDLSREWIAEIFAKSIRAMYGNHWSFSVLCDFIKQNNRLPELLLEPQDGETHSRFSRKPFSPLDK